MTWPGAGVIAIEVDVAGGRPCHFAEIGPDERILAYRIVAPTGWNFHVAGPVVAPLASFHDPCVAFDVTLKEPARA